MIRGFRITAVRHSFAAVADGTVDVEAPDVSGFRYGWIRREWYLQIHFPVIGQKFRFDLDFRVPVNVGAAGSVSGGIVKCASRIDGNMFIDAFRVGRIGEEYFNAVVHPDLFIAFERFRPQFFHVGIIAVHGYVQIFVIPREKGICPRRFSLIVRLERRQGVRGIRCFRNIDLPVALRTFKVSLFPLQDETLEQFEVCAFLRRKFLLKSVFQQFLQFREPFGGEHCGGSSERCIVIIADMSLELIPIFRKNPCDFCRLTCGASVHFRVPFRNQLIHIVVHIPEQTRIEPDSEGILHAQTSFLRILCRKSEPVFRDDRLHSERMELADSFADYIVKRNGYSIFRSEDVEFVSVNSHRHFECAPFCKIFEVALIQRTC